MMFVGKTKFAGNSYRPVNILCIIILCSSVDTTSEGDDYSQYDDDVEDISDSPAPVLPQTMNENNTGRLAFLDHLIDKSRYDKRAWPNYSTDQPTEVVVNVHINSMDNINAANMEFGMDIYLRQSWLDTRLSYFKYGINHSITLNGEDLLNQIWKPDLFFRNLKSARFHKVTVPNKLIRLEPSGHVLFSMRLTLRLSCLMSFRNYPLDKQKCWIIFGSYAQTTEQVFINWQNLTPITTEYELELPEFDIAFQEPGQFMRHTYTGNFSFLNVSFVLVRQNGYHIVQTYLPTFLIVMISWVSFWLNVDATPARVTLGVTTLLTLTTVSSGIRTQLPPVSYVKAIDLWIGACSIMVFGALLEFTLVNYLSRTKTRPPEQRNVQTFLSKHVICVKASPLAATEKGHDDSERDNTAEQYKGPLEKILCTKSALLVDKICRILFPLMFLIFNIIYWTYYLHFS